MSVERYEVVGIGNALVDVLANADDSLLARFGVAKGSMTLIDGEQAERVYGALGAPMVCSGGSAANTMVGLASLGSRAAFIGQVRDDELGRVFRDDIRSAGVTFETPPAIAGPPTGRSMILVTPDAQRTMQTLLGVAGALGPEAIDAPTIEQSRITYLEGYLWDPPPAKAAFRRAAEIAHGAGRQVALSLSDAFCVERHRDEFRALVRDQVDILFGNETEIVSLYGAPDLAAAVEQLRAERVIGVVTLGAAGSLAVAKGEVVRVGAEPVSRVVDTTGAGDLFAAGFLHGLTRDRDLRTCCRLGAMAAAEVIAHYGARPQRPLAALAEQALGRTV